MSVLVTGGGGFLGSHLVERLRAEGLDVTAPRRTEADLTRWEAAERLFRDQRPEVVYHLAAEVGGIGANRANPGRYWYANLMMGANVLELSRLYGVKKVVIAGTVCAYPKFTPVPFREDDLWYGYPEETNAPYGVAKKSVLVGGQSYRQQYGLASVFLLPANLYGPRDNFDLETSHVIPALIRKMIEGRESVELWGDGSPSREFLYVEDAAEAFVLAGERYDGNEPVNVGTGQEITIRELAETIADLTGFNGEIIWNTEMPNGQPRRALDTTRAKEEFGFVARTELREGLKRTIDWFREHHPDGRAAGGPPRPALPAAAAAPSEISAPAPNHELPPGESTALLPASHDPATADENIAAAAATAIIPGGPTTADENIAASAMTGILGAEQNTAEYTALRIQRPGRVGQLTEHMTRALTAGARGTATRISRVPVPLVVAAAIVLQWFVNWQVANRANHNGWLFYHGGDGTWYYTSAWVLSHGHLPVTAIGFVFSLLTAPVAHFTGPNIAAGMPGVIAVNQLLLWPILLSALYGILRLIGGRAFAAAGIVLWTMIPLLAEFWFYSRYHGRLYDQVMPSALGLNGIGDFPVTVALVVTLYFTLTALDRNSDWFAVYAGVAAGIAIGTKPSSGLALPGLILAFAVARRPRLLGLAAAGMAPLLLSLAIWKSRGLGSLPIFNTSATASGASLQVAVPSLNIGTYFPFSWDSMNGNLNQIREYTWSLRLLEWAILAGLLGLWRRSGVAAAAIGGWLAVYFIAKGSRNSNDVVTGTFFRNEIPAFPALFLIVMSIPFLIPGFGARLATAAQQVPRAAQWSRTRLRVATGVAGVCSLVPLVVVLTFPVLHAPIAVDQQNLNLYLPSETFKLDVVANIGVGGSVTLTWPPQAHRGTRVGFAIYRAPEDPIACPPSPAAAAKYCVLSGEPIARTGQRTFTDDPGPGHWVYRVAVTAAPLGGSGDPIALSSAAVVEN